MNVRLPFVQVFILIVFSSLFSFLLNGLRSNGIPLLAKELAVADKVEIKVSEPQLIAITIEQYLQLPLTLLLTKKVMQKILLQ